MFLNITPKENVDIFISSKCTSLFTGDGRNDSPGHCAQYCSYTLMDNDTKKILTIHTLDKRMTDRKSPNMEKAGFEAALNELLEENIKVKEVVTDVHLGIGSIMSKIFLVKQMFCTTVIQTVMAITIDATNFLKMFFADKTHFAEKQYSEIHHSHDIWHAAKNLGKKVLKVSISCE